MLRREVDLAHAYTSACAALAEEHGGLVSGPKALAGFWGRWMARHKEVLARVQGHVQGHVQSHGRAEELEGHIAKACQDLLKVRMRLVSSVAQGLRGEAEGENLRARLGQLVAAHDAQFRRILDGELERLKREMAQAFVARKALSAYAQTVQYRGE